MANEDNDHALVIGDLRKDATSWEDISAALNKALIIINGLDLPYATFDGITHLLGATDAYAAAHSQMADFLKGGVTQTTDIAAKLRATADNMVATDEAAAG
ncbi:hypothetical protein GCM10022198_16530 [Klugiella xanthotipulae]|uniref:Excreted virulence factor EspC (Type VII ESX diderm) n=1 Tax=Klugiella xanthotipulae TaxID=244735 RepID=A0A543HHA9_9MICO|nr:hypothetical protein [Klugiella xanthotipulae]TQM57689.1 hypothetical protein FB466_2685 [Klugiella xanthotipulae]